MINVPPAGNAGGGSLAIVYRLTMPPCVTVMIEPASDVTLPSSEFSRNWMYWNQPPSSENRLSMLYDAATQTEPADDRINAIAAKTRQHVGFWITERESFITW